MLSEGIGRTMNSLSAAQKPALVDSQAFDNIFTQLLSKFVVYMNSLSC